MDIKSILDEIASEPSTNKKMDVLNKYKDNEILKRVLYLANSGRVKFYIKQIPEYTANGSSSLSESLNKLSLLSDRTVTGNEAVELLRDILTKSTRDNAYVIECIIAKDLRINMGGNINKVIPNLIETTPYQGCQSYSVDKVKKLFKNGEKAYGQIKADGQYSNVIVRGGDVELESRQGEPNILTNSKLVKELSKLSDCVLNGELTLEGETNRLIANGIISSIIDITEKINIRTPEETNKKIEKFEKEHNCFYNDTINRIIYTVWDVITPDEYYKSQSNTPYNERLDRLKDILKDSDNSVINIVETVELSSFDESMMYFQHCLDRGLEGCVIKSMKSPWKNGKGPHQIKMKLEMDIDLEIIGFKYGKKGTKNEFVIASLQCKSLDGKLVAEPGGMDEDTMRYVTDNQNNLLGKIVHVKSCGITNTVNGHSLLHPRVGVQKFRNDKNIADSYPEILEIENMAKGLTK